MAATLLPPGGIALVGAPDSDSMVPAMQVDMTQDMVDELLESIRSGKAPQILFGRNPQLKYGDKTHVLQSNPESYRYELYKSSGTGSDAHDDDNHASLELELAGLIGHSLTVQQAEEAAAGADEALVQLKSTMAALSDLKEANKTIVGNTTSSRTPGHRRFPSNGFKHLVPAKMGSPMLSAPSSPMHKRPPTSQPGSNLIHALRVPVLHLLAQQPATEASLAQTCRTSLTSMRELLPKIAKRSSSDTEKWQLIDKVFREINPFQFPYQSSQDRQQAIDNAIKSFDRQRLAKDDKLWQILLPRDERGQGICLSRSTVKAPEAKAKPSTPMHRISDLTKKKPAVKKAESKVVERKVVERKIRVPKDPEVKVKASAKEKAPAKERPLVKDVKYEPKKAPTASTPSAPRPTAPADRYTSSTDPSKNQKLPKKAPAATTSSSTPQAREKANNMSTSGSGRNQLPRPRPPRPVKPAIPINTKPKNPSPLSASPPVNASDLEDSHPVHRALAAAPSPAKTSNGNSDRMLKRKANDIDSDIHSHNLAVKKPHIERATPNHTPAHTNGRLNGSTPSSTSSIKRKSDDSSSSSNTPKARKMTNIDTGLASRYHNNNNNNNPQASPGASSSSTTSPTVPSLSFRQTVELSQRFQKYYKKYEELYWQLTESEKSPTDAQRNELLNMHKKLEEMKREIKAGAGVHR
ncbi:hypothetical protein GQ44DRAFT_778131 [Phaeosphaeriaceae sp. PMI808]|nr:hypothetical protein GQ44DRAFT_778131 [Phaeosphaeriaceae sp. PMI808]